MTRTLPGWFSAILMGIGLPWLVSVAGGQTYSALPPVESNYRSLPPTAPEPTMPVSYWGEPGGAPAGGTAEGNLAERVAALEKALKAAQAKEAAAKAKAAGAPSVRPIGRIFWDTATFSQNAASHDQAGDALNGTEFRNARIGLVGDAFEVMSYKIEMDFAAQTSFKDVYVQVKELPVLQNVRAGHFYEAFGLEAQTGTTSTTFMEKSLIDRFGDVGGYKTGVMVYGSSENKRLFWQIEGNTTLTNDKPPTYPFGPYDDAGGYALSTRVADLLWYDEATQGRGLLDIGASYSYRSIPELIPGQTNRFRLRQKPESNLAPYVIATPWLNDAEQLNALGPELLWIHGPLSFQAEYLWEWLDRSDHANVMFDAGYMYVSYFLTGENRPVERDILRPTRVKPFGSFFRVRTEDGSIETGWGAWEVAYRCSYANLSDVDSGRVVDHTFGLNWYLNPYARLMFNYVHSETSGLEPGPGVLDAFMTRVHMEF